MMRILSVKFNKLMKDRLSEQEYEDFFEDVMSVTREAVECSMEDTIDEEADILVKEHFAASWRDDDSPQAETTLGTHRSYHATSIQMRRLCSVNRNSIRSPEGCSLSL